MSRLKATAYTDSGGEQDSKVTFSVSMKGIDAQTVLDELTNAAVETTNMMAELTSCAWPFGDIDAEETDHVLQTETFQRATVATVGAVVSSALVFDGFTADSFNADSVAVEKFKDVAAALGASLIQIDNILAEDFNHLNAARSEAQSEARRSALTSPSTRGPSTLWSSSARSRGRGHARSPWPPYVPSPRGQPVADADCPTGKLVLTGCGGLLSALLDLRLRPRRGRLRRPGEGEDRHSTLGGTHGDLAARALRKTRRRRRRRRPRRRARIAIALAAVFCFLGGVLATMLYISRMNKFNGCLSSAV